MGEADRVTISAAPEIAALAGAFGAVAVRAAGVAGAGELWPEERAGTGAMRPARLAEFALGRAALRGAITALGHAPAALPRGAGGAPVLPGGILASLTHAPGLCAAMALPAGAVRGVGLDAEAIGRVTADHAALVLTAGEREAIRAMDGAAQARARCLAFSAKEAFYKAQHPLTGRFLDFAEAEVVAQPVGASGSFNLRLLVPVPGLGPAGTPFDGRWCVSGDHVVTALTL